MENEKGFYENVVKEATKVFYSNKEGGDFETFNATVESAETEEDVVLYTLNFLEGSEACKYIVNKCFLEEDRLQIFFGIIRGLIMDDEGKKGELGFYFDKKGNLEADFIENFIADFKKRINEIKKDNGLNDLSPVVEFIPTILSLALGKSKSGEKSVANDNYDDFKDKKLSKESEEKLNKIKNDYLDLKKKFLECGDFDSLRESLINIQIPASYSKVKGEVFNKILKCKPLQSYAASNFLFYSNKIIGPLKNVKNFAFEKIGNDFYTIKSIKNKEMLIKKIDDVFLKELESDETLPLEIFAARAIILDILSLSNHKFEMKPNEIGPNFNEKALKERLNRIDNSTKISLKDFSKDMHK